MTSPGSTVIGLRMQIQGQQPAIQGANQIRDSINQITEAALRHATQETTAAQMVERALVQQRAAAELTAAAMASAAQRVASSQEGAARAVQQSSEDAARHLGQLPDAADEAGQRAGAGFAGSLGDQLRERLPERLQGAAGQLQEWGEGEGSRAGMVAGAAIGAAMAYAISAAMSANSDSYQLQAQLGLTESDRLRYKGVVNSTYSAGNGDSREGVQDTLSFVLRDLDATRTATDAWLADLTGDIESFNWAFATESAEVTRAVASMVKTGLVDSAEEGLDLLTKGMQAGLNVEDDLMDTVNEYGVLWKKAGLDGGTALGIIKQGLDGGARSADLMADLIKEVGIRLGDRSAEEGLWKLGLNATKILDDFAEGGPAAAAAMDMVIDRIRETNSVSTDLATVQMVAGTQAEDLADALNSVDISAAAAALGDYAGAAEGVSDASSAGATPLDTFMVKIDGIAVMMGDKFMPAANTVLDWSHAFLAVLGTLLGWVTQLPQPLLLGAAGLGAIALVGPKVVSALSMVWNEMRNVGTGAGYVHSNLARLGRLAMAGGALVLLGLAMSEIARKQGDINAATERGRTRVKDLASAYQQYGKDAQNAQLRSAAWESLTESDETRKMLQRVQAAGYSADEFLDAYLGLPSGDRVKQYMRAWREGIRDVESSTLSDPTWSTLLQGSTSGGLLEGVKLNAADKLGFSYEELMQLGPAIDGFFGASGDAMAENTTKAEATGDALDVVNSELSEVPLLADLAATAFTDLGSALEDLDGKFKPFDERLQNVLIGLDKAAGRDRTVEQLEADMWGALDNLESSAGIGGEDFKANPLLLRGSGQIDTMTEEGRNLQDGLYATQEAIAAAALAAADKASADGDMAAGERAAQEVIAQGLAEWNNHALAILGSQDAVDKLNGAYGMVQDTMAKEVMVNTTQAEKELLTLTAITDKGKDSADKLRGALKNLFTIESKGTFWSDMQTFMSGGPVPGGAGGTGGGGAGTLGGAGGLGGWGGAGALGGAPAGGGGGAAGLGAAGGGAQTLGAAYNPSGGTEQWRALAAQALQLTGQYSEANVNALLMQMQHESSGNPNAVNNWDSNAKKGTPSKGLMQVIQPTFDTYAMPGYDSNLLDPLSNMIAAIRYTNSRYGSLANGWTARGYGAYDNGGWLPPGGGVGVNFLTEPEPVLTPWQWDIAKKAMDNQVSGGLHIDQVIVQVPGASPEEARAAARAFKDELQRIIDEDQERQK